MERRDLCFFADLIGARLKVENSVKTALTLSNGELIPEANPYICAHRVSLKIEEGKLMFTGFLYQHNRNETMYQIADPVAVIFADNVFGCLSLTLESKSKHQFTVNIHKFSDIIRCDYEGLDTSNSKTRLICEIVAIWMSDEASISESSGLFHGSVEEWSSADAISGRIKISEGKYEFIEYWSIVAVKVIDQKLVLIINSCADNKSHMKVAVVKHPSQLSVQNCTELFKNKIYQDWVKDIEEQEARDNE